MAKVFLSHSGKDKSGYVRTVAEKLGKENIEYDEWTFEEGEEISLEIDKKIDSCAIFAIFISEYALESLWVLKEIERAGRQLKQSQIRKIYPIIIDKKINHNDSRIPKWMQDSYNLKLISRPVVAARRIQSRLREIFWEDHPLFQKRKDIFVGRNDLLKDFENRMDNIDLPKPSCIIASGIKRIGRSKLLEHAVIKANLVGGSFVPVKISLERVESIEDLIYKLYDTGLTSIGIDKISGMLGKTISEKVMLLSAVLRDIQDAKEIVFIEDGGCLVAHNREVAPWLIAALTVNTISPTPVICVSAKYRINQATIRPYANFYLLEVPELSPKERSGLLKRLLDMQELDLSPDDFHFFADQLRGFPEEAYYCVDIIADYGIEGAKKESHQITEFNTERASLLLRRYESNQKALDFIYFLSEFEFVGVSFVYEIVDEIEYRSILDELVTHLICDYVGGEHEYIRLNDTIRDLIKRNRLALPQVFKDKLNKHVSQFISDTDKFERDASDLFYSIKEALMRGEKIDERYLAPSHILRTIKDLYHKRESLKRVVMFADMLLEKESSLDLKVSQDVRYYLCLSLARQKDRRVLTEAQKITGPEHDFILGYYYRLCGRHTDAIERLSKVVNTPYISARAKRELVQVYLYIEEFEKALEMAQENYEANRGNQFPIQSYLQCLLNSDDCTEYRDEINRLINELEQIGSSQSSQMALIAKAIYEAKLNQNKSNAYNNIDDAIALDAESPYPHMAKFDIALRFNDGAVMSESLQYLERVGESRTFSKNTITKNKAYYLAATGSIDEAKRIVYGELGTYPKETIEKILAKLDNVYSRPH